MSDKAKSITAANFSIYAWPGRLFRGLMAGLGSLQAVVSVTDTTWATLPTVLTPGAILGVLIAMGVAASTSGKGRGAQ